MEAVEYAMQASIRSLTFISASCIVIMKEGMDIKFNTAQAYVSLTRSEYK